MITNSIILCHSCFSTEMLKNIKKCATTFSKFYVDLKNQFLPLTSKHSLVQSQSWKYQKNVWHLFRVNNKGTLVFAHCSGISIVVFERVNISWIYCQFNWDQCPIDWFLYGVDYSQLIFTCAKSTMKTLGQCMKSFQNSE